MSGPIRSCATPLPLRLYRISPRNTCAASITLFASTAGSEHPASNAQGASKRQTAAASAPLFPGSARRCSAMQLLLDRRCRCCRYHYSYCCIDGVGAQIQSALAEVHQHHRCDCVSFLSLLLPLVSPLRYLPQLAHHRRPSSSSAATVPPSRGYDGSGWMDARQRSSALASRACRLQSRIHSSAHTQRFRSPRKRFQIRKRSRGCMSAARARRQSTLQRVRPCALWVAVRS